MSNRTREQALAAPEKANAEIAAVLDQAAAGDEPVAPGPPGDVVELPGGLVYEGKTYRKAVIRELTGADEEALSRALAAQDAFRFADVLLARGTVSVGDTDAGPEILRRLLIGDRDELIVAIRCATYGEDMTIEGWQCPACGRSSDISFSLAADLERRPLKDPAADSSFTVECRGGAKARVRLPNGADQEHLFEAGDLTPAQRNSRLLSRITETYTDRHGREYHVAAAPSVVLDMPVRDRAEIIRQVAERQPGPRYNQVEFEHEECGKKVTLALGIADLFQELLAVL